jgi:hypothetical protein
MRIVFDLTTPKQVTFFRPMISRLKEKGCLISVVTRDYKELNLLIRNFCINAKVLGKHGGSTRLGKLKSYTERVRLLSHYFDSIAPDVVVTLSNAESSRAAFGLSIPVVCFNDFPESEAVCKLTLPLASRVCAPWIIPQKEFVKYGVSSEKIFYYNALDPVVWLKGYKVDKSYLDRLKIDSQKPLVVCRETEWQSAYVSTDLIGKVVEELKNKHPAWQIINIPRYKTHRFYDTPSLLANANLFIGGGGTMCIEAAYYGTPVIATRPIECHYMKWLFEKGLSVQSSTVSNCLEKAEEIIYQRTNGKEEMQRKKARKIFEHMEFPLEKITNLIIDTAKT